MHKTDDQNTKRCVCNKEKLLKQITGSPKPLETTEINKILLNLFTERNSDGTGSLVLRGKDLHDRYRKRIKDTDIRAICSYVREIPRRITKLDICYNEITDVGFLSLLKKLLIKGRSSVINLNIMNNNLTHISMLDLAKYASFVKLKYLRVNGNKIGTNGGEYFAEFLKKNNTVQFCDIGDSDQTLSSVAHLMSALRADSGANCTLTVIDFSRIIPVFNRYSYESKWFAYHIENLLERNCTIIELHLQKNEFDGQDIECIVRGLKANKTLLYLDLGYNRIGEYGAEILSEYLAGRPELTLLNIAGNGIKDIGARALSFGLPFSKIRALDVSHNRFTNAGVLDLLNTLKKPYFIRFLNIWGNELKHESCEMIERMLISGVLFQHTIDVKIYEVDGLLYAAYFPNPADRNKHLYYCELDFGFAQPIYHIKRKVLPKEKIVKVDCKHRHKLDKTDKNNY